MGEVCAGAYRLRVVKHRLLTGKVIWVVNFDGLKQLQTIGIIFLTTTPFFLGPKKMKRCNEGTTARQGFAEAARYICHPKKHYSVGDALDF